MAISIPPPSPLTRAQHRELESELRRELAALDRRLVDERADDGSSDTSSRRASDLAARRDAVIGALARVDANTYGTCTRCDAPIPYGRLLAMPEVTHCLGCVGTP